MTSRKSPRIAALVLSQFAVTTLGGVTLFFVGTASSARPRGLSPLAVSPIDSVSAPIRDMREMDEAVLKKQLSAQVELTCSPAPCVLPNLNLSRTARPANETPLAASPIRPEQIVSGSNSFLCEDAGFTTVSAHSFRQTCLIGIPGDEPYIDPVVAYDLAGNAYLGGIEFEGNLIGTVGFEKSADGGKTWSRPRPSVQYILNISGFVDKPWLQIDTNPGSPYANSIYISGSQFDLDDDSQITVSNSHDGGQTWKTVPVAPEQFFPAALEQYSDIAIAADGTVYVAWLQCVPATNADCGGQPATFYLVKSSDGGSSWTMPQPLFSFTLAPDACHCGFYGSLPGNKERVSDIPAIAVDNSKGSHRGYLYIGYYNWTGSYMQVRVATSKDGGSTWASVAVAPDTASHDQFFPWLSVSVTGTVGVSWLDRRNDPNNVNYEAFAAFSTDGGASFSTNVNLSQNSSNPSNDGFAGTFMGDYTGNSWADAKTFYVTYTDTSTGVGQDFIAGIRLK